MKGVIVVMMKVLTNIFPVSTVNIEGVVAEL